MTVRFVSVVLKVVMQNEGDVVDVTLLYLSKESVELRVHCQFSLCLECGDCSLTKLGKLNK